MLSDREVYDMIDQENLTESYTQQIKFTPGKRSLFDELSSFSGEVEDSINLKRLYAKDALQPQSPLTTDVGTQAIVDSPHAVLENTGVAKESSLSSTELPPTSPSPSSDAVSHAAAAAFASPEPASPWLVHIAHSDNVAWKSFGQGGMDGKAFKRQMLATFSRADLDDVKHTKLPRVLSCDHNVCVIFDSHIFLFDHLCKNHLATIAFSCAIEIACFSPDNLFLIIADSLGTLHFMYLPTRHVVFSQEIFSRAHLNVPERERLFQRVFFTQSSTSQSAELVILLRVSLFAYRFSHIHLEQLVMAIAQENMSLANEVKNAIQVEVISFNKDGFDYINDISPEFYVVGKGAKPLTHWKTTDRTCLVDDVSCLFVDGIDLVKLKVIHHLLVVLDRQGDLYILEATTRCLLSHWRGKRITDFEVFSVPIDDPLQQISSDLRIAYLTLEKHSVTNHLCSRLAVARLMTGQIVYGYQVSLGDARLVLHGTHRLLLIYLVNEDNEDSDTELPNERDHRGTLGRKKWVLEGVIFPTVPEILSHKTPSMDAKKGMQQQQQQQPLSANASTNAISATPKKPAVQHRQRLENIEKYEAMLLEKQEKDVPAIMSFAMALDCASLDEQWRIYQLLDAFLSRFPGNPHGATLRVAMDRLREYQIVSLSAFHADEWQFFRQATIEEAIVHFLKNTFTPQSVPYALSLYQRHEAQGDGGEPLLLKVLDQSEEDDDVIFLMPWLAYLMADARRLLDMAVQPETRHRLMQMVDRILIQLTAREALDQARQLISVFFSVLFERVRDHKETTVEKEEHRKKPLLQQHQQQQDTWIATPAENIHSLTSVMSSRQCFLVGPHQDIYQRMVKLQRQLEDLEALRRDHQLTLRFQEYVAMDTMDVAVWMMMCASCDMDELKNAVRQHVTVYCEKHCLLFDDVYVKYCHRLIQQTVTSTVPMVTLSDMAREHRVLYMMSLIGDQRHQIDVLVALMRKSHVPWSQSLDHVILSLKGSSRAIEEQYQLMQLKKMLRHYDLPHFNVSDRRQATHVLHYILSQLDNHTHDPMVDAELFIQVYHHLSVADVYRIRIQFLIGKKRAEEAAALWRAMPGKNFSREAHREVGFMVARWLGLILERPPLEVWNEQDYLYTVHALMAFTSDAKIQTWLLMASELAQQLHRCYRLSDIDTESKRHALLVLEIQHLYPHDDGSWINNMNTSSIALLMRLAAILQLPNHEASVMSLLANHWVSSPTFLSSSPEGHVEEGDVDRRRLIQRLVDAVNGNERLTETQRATVLCDVVYSLMTSFQSSISRVASSLTATHNDNIYQSQDKSFLLSCPLWMLSMTRQAVRLCTDRDDLPACLWSFKTCEVQELCFSETDLYDDVQRYQKNDTDNEDINHQYQQSLQRRRHWFFGHHFMESRMVLSAMKVLGWTSQFPISSFCVSESSLDAMATVSTSLVSLAAELQEKRNEQTRLRVLLHGRECLYRQEQVPDSHRRWSIRGRLEQPKDNGRVLDAVKHLLQKALSARTVDSLASMALMMSLSRQECFDVFRSCVSHLGWVVEDRLVSLAEIGMDVARAWRQRAIYNECHVLRQNAYWWLIFKRFDIHIDVDQYRHSIQSSRQQQESTGHITLTTQGHSYFLSLMGQLFEKDIHHLNIALQFARHYSIEDQHVYMEYFKYLIAHRNTLSSATHGELTSAEMTSFERFVPLVQDKSALVALLTHLCYQRVSPYHYRTLACLLRLLRQLCTAEEEDTARKGLLLLDVLTHFARTHTPTLQEIVSAAARQQHDVILSIFRNKYRLDIDALLADATTATSPSLSDTDLLSLVDVYYPLARQRLPFHTLIWHSWPPLLARELTEQTLPRLLPLCMPLGLPSDTFYVHLIERAARQTPVALETIRSHLVKLKDIDTGLLCIENMTKSWTDEDQRLAYDQLVIYMLERWQHIQQQPQQPSTHVSSLSSHPPLYRRSDRLASLLKQHRQSAVKREIEQLLVQHLEGYRRASVDVSSPDDPSLWIVSLYDQYAEQAWLRHSEGAKEAPEKSLHRVLQTLAQRFSVAMEKLRQELFVQWLLDAAEWPTTSSSASLPSMRYATVFLRQEEEIRRHRKLLYLMLALFPDAQRACQFLLSLAYHQQSDGSHKRRRKMTTMARLRAILLLFEYVEEREIQAVMSIGDLRQYMQMLMYYVDLEALHLPMTLREFQTCDKLALVQSVWRDHRHEPLAVLLCVDLLLDYGESAWIAGMWEKWVAQMQALQMSMATLHVLRKLERRGFTVGTVLGHALFTVVQCTAATEEGPSLSEIYNAVQFSASLLPDSPLALQILEEVVSVAVRRSQPYSALPFIRWLSVSTLSSYLPRVVASENCRTIVQYVMNDREYGVSSLLPRIFEMIDENEWYLSLTAHRSWDMNDAATQRFVNYLIGADQMEKLMGTMLSWKQFSLVQWLMTKYQQMGNHKEEKDSTELVNDAVERYCRDKGMDQYLVIWQEFCRG